MKSKCWLFSSCSSIYYISTSPLVPWRDGFFIQLNCWIIHNEPRAKCARCEMKHFLALVPLLCHNDWKLLFGTFCLLCVFMITISSSPFLGLRLKRTQAIKTHSVCVVDEERTEPVHKSSRAAQKSAVRESKQPRCDIITTNFYLFYNFRIIFLLLHDGQSMGWLFVVAC